MLKKSNGFLIYLIKAVNVFPFISFNIHIGWTKQKYSRSKSLASFSEFLFYCHILSYLFLKNHSEFFTCLRYFMKHAGFTFWTNKYCRFTITKICCSAWTIIQTFFCSIANYFKLFRIGIVIISVSAELRIVSEKRIIWLSIYIANINFLQSYDRLK